MKQFAIYALTKEAGELEANEWFKTTSEAKINEGFSEVLKAVHELPLPDWDQ